MKILTQEEALFAEWRSNRSGFVSDGVVSEADYLESEVKLCFILKEVNDPKDGGEWDLRTFLYKGARPQTWNNIARWVNNIRFINRDIKWAALSSVTKEYRKQHLRSICAMNLKKSPGGHTTNVTKFKDVVEDDRAYIKRQYDIYHPDITICCGTGQDFRLATEMSHTKVLKTSRGVKWFKNLDGNPVIMYVHPAARVHASFLTYGLIDAVREIYS